MRSGVAFARFLAVILVAEAITLLVAWFSVGAGVNRWIENQAARLVQISRQAAHADWSLIDRVPAGKDSDIFDRYADRLESLSSRSFPRKEGTVYLVVIRNSEELDILSGDPIPLDDIGKANAAAMRSFTTKTTTWTPGPVSDDTGTYLAAYTPIIRNGKVLGLVAAERDTAPLGDIQDIVRTAFWYAVVPAILLPILFAYLLTRIFVEPMTIFRTIEERARLQRDHRSDQAVDEPWNRLTVTEKKIAELARQGFEVKEMATELAPWYLQRTSRTLQSARKRCSIRSQRLLSSPSRARPKLLKRPSENCSRTWQRISATNWTRRILLPLSENCEWHS